MLNIEFDKENGILFLTPNGKLEKKDFEKIASEVDPYIEKEGKLEGLLLSGTTFPYWKDFESMVTHFKFVREHQKNLKKLAVVSDDTLLGLIPKLASHFVNAEVHHFKAADRDKALEWIKE
jgi:hypothetical protein